MELDRTPKPGDIYKHFKDKLYQIITIATHSETNESMVVYQALYGTFKTYVRPLDMFLSEVDHHKYPEVKQLYRFEPVVLKEDEVAPISENENTFGNVHLSLRNKTDEKLDKQQEKVEAKDNLYENTNADEDNKSLESIDLNIVEEGQINPILLDFLDARSYDDKLAILLSKKKHITDKLLNDMAVSLDVTVDEGDIEERIRGFVFCLQTLARFESKRLR